MSDITRKDLQDRFIYDNCSGLLYWKYSPIPNVEAGSLAGSQHHTGYRDIKVKEKTYRAHRLIWLMHYGTWPTKYIDHINGDRTDNRIENLRDTSVRGNSINKQRHRDGKKAGVTFKPKLSKWYAKIYIKGSHRFIGSYDTEDEAHSAYTKVAENPDSFRNSRDIKKEKGIPTGITFHKCSGKWRVQVYVSGKQTTIKACNTLQEAIHRLSEYKMSVVNG